MVIAFPCCICQKHVKCNHKALLCTECDQWIHIKCGGVSSRQYGDISQKLCNWQCPLQEMPFWNVDATNSENSTTSLQFNDTIINHF